MAIFLASFALAAFVIAHRHGVERVLGGLGVWAFPLAAILMAFVASAPFSVTDALAIMNGVLFGPLWGSVVNAVGIVLAAIIGYTIALRTARLLNLDAQLERLPGWVRRYRVGSPMFLVAVRILPGLGGTIATQVAASLRVPLIVQIWTMSVVAVPICTVLAIFGNGAATYVEAHVVVPARSFVHTRQVRLRNAIRTMRHHLHESPAGAPGADQEHE